MYRNYYTRSTNSVAEKTQSTNMVRGFLSKLTLDNSVYLGLRGFRILDEIIGEGTFGKVKKARYRGKEIAVKVIQLHELQEKSARKCLPREISVLREVRHKNIVQVFKIFEFPRRVCIFMELTEGDLFKYMQKKRRLSEGESHNFFEQTVSAIQYLHSMNIAHRDIKCENLLLTKTKEVKVADFGYCKRTDLPFDLSRTFCASYDFAPPEIIKEVPYDPFKSDIWSLGCVLYVMVTGKKPFLANSVLQFVKKQECKFITYPASCRLSKLVMELIEQMLEPNVEQRLTIDGVKKSDWLEKSNA